MTRKSSKERRAEIVDALLRVMADQGYAKATISKIADEADLTTGLIHYHFKNKQEILLEVLKLIISGRLDSLQARWDSCSTDWERVQAFISVHLSSQEEVDPHTVATWVTITAEAIRQPEVGAAFREAIGQMNSLLIEVIQRGAKQNEFRLDELTPEACSAAIMCLIQGYFNLGVTVRESIPRGTATPAAVAMARGLLGNV